MNQRLTLHENVKSAMVAVVFPLSLVVAYLVYTYILGDPANFEGGSTLNEPIQGNYLGVVYKGGYIVVLLLAFQIILLTFILERFFTITSSRGKQKNQVFVKRIKSMLDQGQIKEAIEACDKQKGSLANVIRSGLVSYQEAEEDTQSNKDKKLANIEKDLEEATQLEIPSLVNNLVIISTLASVATLIGLLGTVTGMIKAFAALARAGSPDPIGLANGISQALVTTALGISTAAVAIVFYNYFTNRIDRISYAIDEAAFSILHTFKSQNGEEEKELVKA